MQELKFKCNYNPYAGKTAIKFPKFWKPTQSITHEVKTCVSESRTGMCVK